MNNAALDLVFSASRDINEGEELSTDYGKDWIYLWAHYLSTRIISINKDSGDEELPKFRVPIVAEHLFPDTWLDVELQLQYKAYQGYAQRVNQQNDEENK